VLFHLYSISGLRPVLQSPATFVFPACDACNAAYSELEGRISVTVQRLLAGEPISEIALSEFLDWLDKVRVDLWLGDMMRNKEYVSVERHFHVSQRVGRKDRFMLLFNSHDAERGFTFAGTFLPAFHLHPSCFGLRINGLYILNMSADFLFMHRLGFPAFIDR
jgi:hypothetical protein